MTIARFVVLTLLLVFIDSVFWLSWTASRIYKPAYTALGLQWKPNMLYGLFSWLCIAKGLYMFVLPSRRSKVFVRGCIMGFVIYGTYNFTNLAVIPGFSLRVALLDLLWGTLLCGTVSTLFSHIAQTYSI